MEYEDMFELSPIGYFILDKNGVIERANARASVHFGFDQKLLVGKTFSDFISRQSGQLDFFTHSDLIINEQKIIQLECDVRRQDGTSFPALIKSIVIRDNASVFKHMFTILTDISRIRDHEHQVEISLNKAERLNEMFSSFMSIASHEFRTPLSAVLSSNSLVEKYAKLGQTEMMQKHFSRIKSSVKLMVSIIEDFLSLERSENVEVRKTDFNLILFCQDIIEEIAPQAKSGQMINLHSDGKAEIYSDRKRLQHIVLNLLSNACKYSPENSEITFTANVLNDRILITIKDMGIGIAEAQQEMVFTRLFRAQNAVSVHGTGLGLYICKRYVQLLHGSISFISSTDKGTTFCLDLPQNVN